IDVQPLGLGQGHYLRYVGRFHEPVAGADPADAVTQLLDFYPLGFRHLGGVGGEHRKDYQFLIHGPRLVDIVEEHGRHFPLESREEHADTGQPYQISSGNLFHEFFFWYGAGHHHYRQPLPAVPPGDHDNHDQQSTAKREPAAGGEFLQACTEVGEVQNPEKQTERQGPDDATSPDTPANIIEYHRSDEHGPGNRYAVGVGEVIGRLEVERYRDGSHHHKKVYIGEIDLPFGHSRCVHDPHARQEAQLNGLAGQREDPGDDGLRSYDRGNRGEHDHRVEQSVWNEAEKHRVRLCRVVQDHGALA